MCLFCLFRCLFSGLDAPVVPDICLWSSKSALKTVSEQKTFEFTFLLINIFEAVRKIHWKSLLGVKYISEKVTFWHWLYEWLYVRCSIFFLTFHNIQKVLQTKCTFSHKRIVWTRVVIYIYIFIFFYNYCIIYQRSILYHNTTKSIISLLRGVQEKKKFITC